MDKLKSTEKKSVIGPIVSVFVVILVVSILAGLTFLFISQFKNNVADTTIYTATVLNETGAAINATGYTVDEATSQLFQSFAVTEARNGSNGVVIHPGNYTVNAATGVITNASAITWDTVQLDYTYKTVDGVTAYTAVNGTEAAGSTVVSYLSLIFLAIIFGALLTLVLKIILPYVNLGQSMGGF